MTDLLTERWRALLPDEEEQSRRFVQGRAFFRSGRVSALRVEPGRLSASVQGARATPYHVEVLVEPLDRAAWTEVVRVVAGEVRFAAALLAGRYPPALDDVLADAGLRLVSAGARLDARCPCGEAARPCAHVYALWEAAADRFTDDPFALLQLRGRGRQRFLADLSAARRGHGAEPAARVDLAELDSRRWERTGDEELVTLGVPVDVPEPDTPAAPLRLLGDPPGWAGAQSATEALTPLVVAGAARARALLEELRGGG